MSEIISQKRSILNHLMSGGKLTGIEALKLFHCFRLPARVYSLKSEGHNIQSRTITRNGKRYSQYYIDKAGK